KKNHPNPRTSSNTTMVAYTHWFRASRGEHLHLLRFRRSSRRDHRRKRHEHHPSALFLPSCLHRRPDLVERRERLASFPARSRTVRLLRLAWCIMYFHQRDETRSTEFHRVPQLRGRINFEHRLTAHRRGSHHE